MRTYLFATLFALLALAGCGPRETQPAAEQPQMEQAAPDTAQADTTAVPPDTTQMQQ